MSLLQEFGLRASKINTQFYQVEGTRLAEQIPKELYQVSAFEQSSEENNQLKEMESYRMRQQLEACRRARAQRREKVYHNSEKCNALAPAINTANRKFKAISLREDMAILQFFAPTRNEQ